MNPKTAKKLRRLARLKAAALPKPYPLPGGIPSHIVVTPHQTPAGPRSTVSYHPERSERGIYKSLKDHA